MKLRKHPLRLLPFVFVLLCLLTGLTGFSAAPRHVDAAPQMGPADSVIISEFRLQGSNGSNDEFIEIFNPTSSPVNLQDWAIGGANSTGNSAVRYTFPSGISLQAGQHYLIAHTNFDDVDADAIYLQAIADNGGVAIIDNLGNIIDSAGLSAGTVYKEGNPLSPLTGNIDQSYERQANGTNCEDSDDNSVDFHRRFPSDPQNSLSPSVTCTDPTATPTFTSTATGTATGTSTATATFTATHTGTATSSATPQGSLSIIINEVAWAGTAASTSDEWIELYNPGTSEIDLATGWKLRGADLTPNINLTGKIPAGGYYLLERGDDNTVIDVVANQIFTDELENSVEILQLYDPSNRLIDTANTNGGNWPAGESVTFGSMERRGVIADSDTAWITNVRPDSWTKHDARGNSSSNYLIHGTPGYANWAYTVTPTASPRPTDTKPRTPTRVPTLAPQPLVAINEFVPRPGHDWNLDGEVNVEDEYIEIINHGTINVTLSGYTLDDEANIGSKPYSLPALTIKPGERLVFYGSETGLLLSDGGDGVRLLRPNGQLMDAYNYTVARYSDQSYCRLPDNGGLDDWNQNCYPTPGLQNSLGGSVFVPAYGVDLPFCPIADTLPDDFVLAECIPFGNNIWRWAFWDETGWYGEKVIPGIENRRDVFVD